MINIYEAVDINKKKSAVILVAFVLFVTAVVYLFSQAFGVYLGYETSGLGLVGLALIVSGLMSIGSYYFSDRIILAISKARPADKKRDYLFFTVVENLTLASGLPMPRLYVIEDSSPNAFATGRDPQHAVVCVTSGLLEKLDRTELEGVVAHELSHIRNFDIRLSGIVAVLVGLVTLLADWFLRMSWYGRQKDEKQEGQLGTIILLVGFILAIISPIIAKLIQLAISRRREILADVSAVLITKQPQGLISALKKISQDKEPLEVANKATAHLYIVNPFKGKDSGALSWFANLFNTHPPIEERIAMLEKMNKL